MLDSHASALHFKHDHTVLQPLGKARKSSSLKLLLDRQQYQRVARLNTSSKDAVVDAGKAKEPCVVKAHLVLVEDATQLGCRLNDDDARQEWPPGDMAGDPRLVRSDFLHADGLGIGIIHPHHTIELSHVPALWQ